MNLAAAKTNMISQQLRTCNIVNPAVLQLISDIPREEFVPVAYRDAAYSDLRIPLAYGQTMMTPLEEATLLQSLQLTKDKTVLEVGTGTGYLTTLLAKLVKHVYSIDYFADFTRAATKKLAEHSIANATLITGDGYRGYMEQAPYDVIILTGAIAQLADCYRPQLMRNGQLFAILGTKPALEACTFTLDDTEHWHTNIVFDTDMPPLINRLAKPPFSF